MGVGGGGQERATRTHIYLYIYIYIYMYIMTMEWIINDDKHLLVLTMLQKYDLKDFSKNRWG